MALFQSGNPTLSQKIFDRSRTLEGQMNGTMTVRGTLNKFGFLLFMVLAGAIYTWYMYYNGQLQTMQTFILIGAIGGFAAALAIIFKPTWAPFVAPIYGILEGFFVGALSAILNDAFAKKYPGLVLQAVGLTFAVALAMFLLYNFRIIKPTQKLKSIVITATVGLAIFYAIDALLFYAFHIDIPITSWSNNSGMAIGFSILVICLAALNFILDFEMIENGADMGAPKRMEWYGAFGLLVTLIWLYIEILKLLSRIASSRN
ncbi:MAG TPA: Bax inhibitor-1/YccA family protein [Chitinophagaceae bacterium]|jgi:uncharacterized YccA/Bax inhibitor family protein|nr:Bax inhibitor-1/YccA family protein [Chitinophagaceae bacterium]